MTKLAGNPQGLSADLEKLTYLDHQQRSKLIENVDDLVRSLSMLGAALGEATEGL